MKFIQPARVCPQLYVSDARMYGTDGGTHRPSGLGT